MLDLEPIFEFSRNNCITICAFLVPANLLTTLQTMILVFLNRSILSIRLSAAIAITFALTLFLHVATWFVIGVVTPVTFILGALGTTCILINLFTIIYRQRLYLLREKVAGNS
ncbi:hypothetical protein Xen7305DRAFT_00025840 [Xenococcus sp. PCC 7305]|uniref:hypothetical protein n=1 Tax=Xenococcus sp. PCC 7305 TaxID=102125 RepID=UPI0002AC3BAF|nr:hypothetical protein [Xenococcus sp. PCC 7305]ELS02866.1 hypothetical protein Xen7305DRAFT_00025840 [Xenococcus sp. PCC 7305]